MAEVHIQDGETLENALRRFKRKVLQEDERQSNRPVQSSFGGKPNGFRREFFTG